MEGSVTIPIEEYELLTGIKKDFDEKLKSELKRMNEGDRVFVLRDRDEYVRRNERLLKENSEKAEELRKVAEANVKLRHMRDSMFNDLVKERAHKTILEARLDTAEQEIKRRDENEKTLRETVNRLRKERADALNERDEAVEGRTELRGHLQRLRRRGLFSRIFNLEP